MSELLRLNRLALHVKNLGYGNRIVVWTQGCRFGCVGCCSANTHALDGGAVQTTECWIATVEELLNGERIDGLTVSGGEPTLQSRAVGELIQLFRKKHGDGDVLLYSGRPLSKLTRDYPDLADLCDAVVAEPYRQGIPPVSRLHGSGNQIIRLLTRKAEERYTKWLHEEASFPLAMTRVNGRAMDAVGIPGHHDLERLTSALAKRGIRLEHPSWRI
jgi:anaerobic ribonucleoside-triphosphate reductase activating protein